MLGYHFMFATSTWEGCSWQEKRHVCTRKPARAELQSWRADVTGLFETAFEAIQLKNLRDDGLLSWSFHLRGAVAGCTQLLQKEAISLPWE